MSRESMRAVRATPSRHYVLIQPEQIARIITSLQITQSIVCRIERSAHEAVAVRADAR